MSPRKKQTPDMMVVALTLHDGKELYFALVDDFSWQIVAYETLGECSFLQQAGGRTVQTISRVVSFRMMRR